MSMLKKKIFGVVADGAYKVKYLGAVEHPALDSTKKEYVTLKFQCLEFDNIIEFNAFENQLDWFTRQLIRKYFPNQVMSFLDCVESLDELVIYKSTNVTESGTYQNYAFEPPKAKVEAPVVADDENPFC